MRAKVLKRFRDKKTLTLHKKNEEIEITAGRFAEINGTPAGILVKGIKKPKEGGEKNAGRNAK